MKYDVGLEFSTAFGMSSPTRRKALGAGAANRGQRRSADLYYHAMKDDRLAMARGQNRAPRPQEDRPAQRQPVARRQVEQPPPPGGPPRPANTRLVSVNVSSSVISRFQCNPTRLRDPRNRLPL